MPNRIIKESICTSPNLDRITPEEERLFYRIIVNCDDFGRLDGRPKIIKAKCFPLKTDEIPDNDITAWLESLAGAELISIYYVKGEPYIQLATWEEHQTIRAKRSKYPNPNGNQPLTDDVSSNLLNTSVSNSEQPQADVPVIQSNPIQLQSESNTIPIFDFWNSYKIVVHKKLNDKTKRAIETALKTFTKEEIEKAITIYAEILKEEKYFWNHTWTLKDFLVRGLEKFILPEDVVRQNYLKDKGNGTHKRDFTKIPKHQEHTDETTLE